MSGVLDSLAILVAEDDPTLGEAIARFLREKGHQVDLARHGGEALEMLKKGTYALVITDLVMPEADGLTVLRAARQYNPASLVVIMTGYASIDSAIQATREGAYDYLRKPFKLQELDIAVANAARLLSLNQENQSLLHKLTDLTARLEDLEQVCKGQQEDAASGDKTQPSRFSLPLFFNAMIADQEYHQQKDLERLQNLYKESLLTEKEYQILKQRLLI